MEPYFLTTLVYCTLKLRPLQELIFRTSRRGLGAYPASYSMDIWGLSRGVQRWIIRPHYGPGVDSASNRNEYQE
jgi:hypothetical protein